MYNFFLSFCFYQEVKQPITYQIVFLHGFVIVIGVTVDFVLTEEEAEAEAHALTFFTEGAGTHVGTRKMHGGGASFLTKSTHGVRMTTGGRQGGGAHTVTGRLRIMSLYPCCSACCL